MTYDFYVNFRIEEKDDVDSLTSGLEKYSEIKDPLARIMLLNTVFGVKGKWPDKKGRPQKIAPEVYAKVGEERPCGLKALIHSNGNYNDSLRCKLSELNLIGINQNVDISHLPYGSWLIEFPITLAKPFISKDDVPLYIIDNPIRKDKVFGIPFTSAMAWKGNLRWTMMRIHLEPISKDDEKFSEVRFNHTLLFGTEKGMEEEPKGWANYLDNLCPSAKDKYREKFKELFKTEELPNLVGMLHFYPVFWNRIDMGVINPLDRETKTGRNPIYYEVVPEGAKGIFRLVYIPFYHLVKTESELKSQVLNDLSSIILGLREMMLTYGFSAKKSSGYGLIKDEWDRAVSNLVINGLSEGLKFGNFKELCEKIKELREK